MSEQNEDKRNEKLGKTIAYVGYWITSLMIVAMVTIIAFVVLYFVHLPLWIAPIIGVGVMIIYRLFRRMVVMALIRLGRSDNKK